MVKSKRQFSGLTNRNWHCMHNKTVQKKAGLSGPDAGRAAFGNFGKGDGDRKLAGILTEDLIYEILSVVEEIPEGKVASYGQIAKLIGRDKNARLVGKVLSMAEYYGEYPCHRVVNHAGRLAPFFYEQKELLLEEGVEFWDDTHVDMKKCRWDC